MGLAQVIKKQKERVYSGYPMTFKGGLLGVSAEVLLYRKAEYAVIRLKGVPVGGSLNGMAWYKKDGWEVQLDERIAAALKRRMIKIVGVGAFHDYQKLWVLVHFPLGIGRKQIVLERVTTEEDI